ncbi:hypothetical protein [Burkholderia vietnamiensis]|uniref:hypothetical protein n=1 Tax=Burkholderia vietnamiensis TaxID=60552 RepID=UPI001CF1C67E|nr:hypothetical protein [Burkholderia vietnamiensis]MCA8285395.1 hypothetical protein [Burkholderia vietnamiensis]
MKKNENVELSSFEVKKIIENFTNSLVFNSKSQSISEILSIIDSPFSDYKNNDILSMIFHRFFTNTEIPVALPVFGFLSLISAWCVKNKATITLPLDPRPHQLATWTILLAPSGSSKSMSSSIVNSMVPSDMEGEKVIKPNFHKPNGPAAFVEQVNKLDDGELCCGFWLEDEVSQMFKLVEQEGHPMNEIREHLLKMKDNEPLSRISKGNEIKTKPVVMTQLFINTIDSFAKHITDESMKDGLMRRYQFVMAQKDEERDFTDFDMYNVSNIRNDIMVDKFEEVFNQNIANVNFTFSKGCRQIYKVMFKEFWYKQYVRWMTGQENFYRTYMMEAWKYAVFHHIIHLKKGYEVQEDSMQWGLKVVMLLLNSFERFIEYRANKPQNIISQRSKVEKYIEWIRSNEGKKGFGIRAFYKRFKITKEQSIDILKNLKANNPKLKSSIFDGISIDIEKKEEKPKPVKSKAETNKEIKTKNEIDDAFDWTDEELDSCLDGI